MDFLIISILTEPDGGPDAEEAFFLQCLPNSGAAAAATGCVAPSLWPVPSRVSSLPTSRRLRTPPGLPPPGLASQSLCFPAQGPFGDLVFHGKAG